MTSLNLLSAPYFIPQHGVQEPNSSTIKLRVVFNASQLTNTKISLNDLVQTRAKLQQNLIELILQLEMSLIRICCGYRKNVLTNPHDDDMDFKRILWKPHADQLTQKYQLLTVIYGMACAPLLALRTLCQLARDKQQRYSSGAQALLRNMYVDMLAGASSDSEAIALQQEISTILLTARFQLRK